MKYPAPLALVSALTITISGLLNQGEQNQPQPRKQLPDRSVNQESERSVNQESERSTNGEKEDDKN